MIRPTGLVDPEVLVRPTKGQIDDLVEEIRVRAEVDQRVLVTTLTKKMAEDLSDYLLELGVRARYLHSDIDTLERVQILRDLRMGEYDVLIGINLLREGLDLPEVSLVAILDADKEGFLRSETSLVQTIGRAARNVDGAVVMYADAVTDSMRRALSETNRRRTLQLEYNEQHGIDPQTIRKKVSDILELIQSSDAPQSDRRARELRRREPLDLTLDDLRRLIQSLEEEMHEAASELRFEYAARLRDEVDDLKRELRELVDAEAIARSRQKSGVLSEPGRLAVEVSSGLASGPEARASRLADTSRCSAGNDFTTATEFRKEDDGERDDPHQRCPRAQPEGPPPRVAREISSSSSPAFPGSGKSSLAFDTIYAEGQRRYVESLSAYARQFLGQMDKPDVDFIEGLSPAISIDQKTASRNPRSTVGTVTEIHDYLRLLYARVGIPHCPNDGSPVARQTPQQIVDRILEIDEGTRFQILAPVIRGRKGEYEQLLKDLALEGFSRARIDGEVRDLTDDITLDRYFQHTIEVVVDRLVRKDGIERRLSDSLETALRLADGIAHVAIEDGPTLSFSQHFACPECGLSFDELQPRNFSFNSPYGACQECSGIGTRFQIDPALIVPQPDRSLFDGAIAPWRGRHRMTYYQRLLSAVAAAEGIDMDRPYRELSEEHRDAC